MMGGGFRIRPAGGGRGCLAMLLFSILASIVLTIVLNLALHIL